MTSHSPSHLSAAAAAGARCTARWLRWLRWEPDARPLRTGPAHQRRRHADVCTNPSRNSEAQPVATSGSGTRAGARTALSQTPLASSARGLSELLLWRLSLKSPQAELRNCGMDWCIHQRAVVAGALGQSVVVAHQAPIAAIAAIPRSAVLLRLLGLRSGTGSN